MPINHLEGVHTENSNSGIASSVGAGGIYTDEVGYCVGSSAKPAFRGCFVIHTWYGNLYQLDDQTLERSFCMNFCHSVASPSAMFGECCELPDGRLMPACFYWILIGC